MLALIKAPHLILVATIFVLCHNKTESFASQPVASNGKHDSVPQVAPTADVESNLNRIFVAGISPTCTRQDIESTFSQFGRVQDVIIIDHNDEESYANESKRRPLFCFVTFEDASSAKRALAAPKPSSISRKSDSFMYKEIRPAIPIGPRRRSNESRLKEEEKVRKIEEYGKDTNCIVQVQSTHVDRLTKYLHQWSTIDKGSTDTDGAIGSCKVLGSTNTHSKNVSLLFISCTNPTALSRELYSNPLLARAINKSYIVQPRLLEGNLSTEQGMTSLVNTVYENILSQCKDDAVSLRIQAFPPKYYPLLVKSLGSVISDNKDNSSQKITIAPKKFSNMLSIVEVYQYRGKGWERRQKDEDNRFYMVGISPASKELDVVDTNNIISDDPSGYDVSRAYFKLKEAIEMYEACRGAMQKDLAGSIALDCGSSPGGWTKYLIEYFNCKRVYSIDPGSLSPLVLNLRQTKHMQMKVQDAMPQILEDYEHDHGKVKIWVSDMCLHNMEEQVDVLLDAKKQGLLESNAFFVLTLKCIVGHSKTAYDGQVKRVVDKLHNSANVNGVETFHLFSNRSGERTVMGYIK